VSLESISLADISLLIVLGTYAGLAILDLVRPARRFERVPHWRIKGAFFFVLYLTVATVAPFVWDAFLAEHHVLNLSALALGWQVLAAVLAVEVGVYFWHRSLHRVPWLWRWFHQMHHSSERIDIWSAMYFHPLDMLGFSLVGSLGLVWFTGVAPEAAVIANTLVFFLATVQHANIRTPHWLGYIVGRPEMHGRHHERGVHASNYSDLPLLDMLFGTYDNPRTWDAPAGFYSGGSQRTLDMLVGRDILLDRSRGEELPSAAE
jgi:sterol desaturase/sphingolipid hydroxylase (fatty acid hydroxylase superfamily)